MTAKNSDIARILNRLADLLEIEGADAFRVRAYRNGARVIEDLPHEAATLLAEGGNLRDLPGIGEALAKKIREVVDTGRLKALEEAEGRLPGGLADLATVQGLGPKRVKTLYEKLGVSTFEDLAEAARAGRVRDLPGFGEASERKILQGLERRIQAARRTPLPLAESIAAPVLDALRTAGGVHDLAVAGSFRRRADTVGDLDILAACAPDTDVMERFVRHDQVAEVISEGTTRSTVRLKSGVQVDLRAVPTESYGAALNYFTGSKAHNIRVRSRGVDRGLRINEYGVFRSDGPIAGRTEEEVYAAVGLPYIPPELREDRGEIEAAEAGTLPDLVTVENLRGDLHAHTTATDGRASLEEMVRAARDRGYEYLAITDHTRSLTVARGQDPKRLAAQIAAIDRLNAKLEGAASEAGAARGRATRPRRAGFRVLKSAEVDILEDGSLDLPDDILKDLDLTVCSIHTKFDLPRDRQTERVLRAMDNRHFNILGHPTCRLFGRRDPSDLDLERIMRAAKERGCALEINAQPERLDLVDIHCRMAREIGVKVVISTDSHSVGGLDLIRFGVDQARRGWLGPADVLNTRPWAELRTILRR